MNFKAVSQVVLVAMLPFLVDASVPTVPAEGGQATMRRSSHSSCERGPRGPRGKKGEKGATGPRGFPGPAGPAGGTGAGLNNNYVFAYTANSQVEGDFSNVSFETVALINGWTHPNATDFVCSQAGNYLVTYRVNFSYDDIDTDLFASSIATLNGDEIVGSQNAYALAGTSAGIVLGHFLTATFLIEAAVGDVLDIQTDTSTSAVGSGTPVDCAITITRVS